MRIIIYLLGVSILMCIVSSENNIINLFTNKQYEILKADEDFDKYILGVDSIPKIERSFLKTERDLTIKSSFSWLKSDLVNLEDVLNYVLPHKVNNSFDFSWREEIRKDIPLKEENRQYSIEEFIKFCKKINHSILGKISFERTSFDESFMSYNDLKNSGRGTCIAMTDYTNYTFRSFGIPTTTDFIPTWGNLNAGSHAWNVLLLKYSHLPFMGTESYINEYDPLILSKNDSKGITTLRIPPKVYRKSKYDINSFVYFKNKVLDVTNEYVEVIDITIKNYSQFSRIYLATFNNGKYNINSIGEPIGNKVIFRNMAKGLAYFPVTIVNGYIKPIDYPIVSTKKSIEIASPKLNHLADISIDFLDSFEDAQFKYIKKNGYNIKKSDIFYSDKIRSHPINGIEYEIYYWDMEWKLIKANKCTHNKLIFKDIPSNAVYLVKKIEEDFSEKRIFTLLNNSLHWF